MPVLCLSLIFVQTKLMCTNGHRIHRNNRVISFNCSRWSTPDQKYSTEKGRGQLNRSVKIQTNDY